jgi:transposase
MTNEAPIDARRKYALILRDAGMRTEEIAEKIGVHKTTIQRWLTDERQRQASQGGQALPDDEIDRLVSRREENGIVRWYRVLPDGSLVPARGTGRAIA